MTRRRYLPTLYLQVLIGIAVGIGFGLASPEPAVAMKPFGDGFIKLVRMLITPIIFTTVVAGISHAGGMKEFGRIGLRALLYFEGVSTLALIIGLVVVGTLQPGAGFNFDPDSVDVRALASYTAAARNLHTTDFLLNIVPETMFSAFSTGDILQVLLVSIMFGVALLQLGASLRRFVDFVATVSDVLFQIVAVVMHLAPLGAFGAMSFTVGRYGFASLLALGKLMAAVYVTCALFVFLILGAIAAAVGFNLLKFLLYIREELLIVLGTSSSESVLPRMMAKLEHLGCSRPVVGLVIPTGYSFNLDGMSIYMTMAAMFVAQASNVHLTLRQEVSMLALMMLTSKGSASVTGAGFVTLAATLSAFPSVPVAGLTLLVGVDRFMSEARSMTNLIGNGVATMVVARWNGALDLDRARRILDNKSIDEPAASHLVPAVDSDIPDYTGV